MKPIQQEKGKPLQRPTVWPENFRAKFFIVIRKKPEHDPNWPELSGRVRAARGPIFENMI